MQGTHGRLVREANHIPLERVDAHVERDDTNERDGRYKLVVRVAFHGPLAEGQRARLYAAVARCPVSKLMTTTEGVIETAPLISALEAASPLPSFTRATSR